MAAIQKLRIDLSRWKCTSLRITTEATLTEDVAGALDINPKRRFTTLYEEYTRSDTKHLMMIRLVRHLSDPNQYAIRVMYQSGEPSELMSRRMVKASTLTASEGFLRLCDLESPLLFRCVCSFSYRYSDKEVAFLLPLKIENDDLFDEVRGLRMVKLERDKILWEAFVDLVETDLMVHRISFAHESKFSVDLPQKLLKQAKAISRKA